MILNIADAGEGQPIVLLHGLFGRSQNLGALARRLAARARVISMDLRNHGASLHAPGMDYKTLASDVMETLSALSIPKAALLGHSMGGKTAMAAALMAPSRVSRLLVSDIAPIAYDHHNLEIATGLQTIPLHAGLTRAEAGAALQRCGLEQERGCGMRPDRGCGLEPMQHCVRELVLHCGLEPGGAAGLSRRGAAGWKRCRAAGWSRYGAAGRRSGASE